MHFVRNFLPMREIEPNSDLFIKTLEETLKHFTDAQWLGRNSPLAAPYFLHRHLKNESLSESRRGEILQDILTDLSRRFTVKEAAYYSELLKLYYFEELAPGEVQARLNIGRTKLSQDRREALLLLASELIHFIYPALRLEAPPIPTTLLEREKPQKAILDFLQAGKMVALVGASGIGKTTLAGLLARSFSKAGSNAFWYTIRPDLNDQVESFIFAVGYFAHQQGHSILWQELIATQGKAASEPKREKLLQMLRHLFTQMHPCPLLCIDEVDHLQSSPDHASLIRLIESLRGLVPILLIGQNTNILSDHSEMLGGLSEESLAKLLRLQGVRLDVEGQSELHQLTKGNPRLIQLYGQALQSGESSQDLLTTLSTMPILETLFSRILQRLSQAELETLMMLSVYPLPAPSYIGKAKLIESLQRKQLLQADGSGGVEVPALLRPLIVENLSTEQAANLHRCAATVRSETAAITAAAYHWIAAGEPEQAFLAWEHHQLQEINQGQAATALRLFRRLVVQDLPTALRERVRVLCGNLENLVGQPLIALEDIRSLLQKQSLAALEASDLEGRIHNERHDSTHARNAFHRAQELAEMILEARLAMVHKGLSWGYWNENELRKADEEIDLAAYEVENMRGNLARERFHYEQARTHYLQAIQLAEACQYEAGIAKSCNQLAGILMLQGDFETCFQLLQRAYAIHEQIGKVRSMSGYLSSMAVAHNLAGDHPTALQCLDKAEKLLGFLTEIETNLMLPILQARAEAYLGLGEIDRAEQFAQQVLAIEDEKMSRDAGWVLGEVAIRRQAWQAAVTYLRNTIENCLSDSLAPDHYVLALAYRSLARAYAQQGLQHEAVCYQQAAIDHFTSIQLPNEIMRTQAMFA